VYDSPCRATGLMEEMLVKKQRRLLYVIGVSVVVVSGVWAWEIRDRNDSQTTLANRIFSEDGYTIISQSQNVMAKFTLDPSWIPKRTGEHFEPHKVFYQGHHTEIFVQDVFRRTDGDVWVVINAAPTYSNNGGDFVSVSVVHHTGSGHTYSFIPWGGFPGHSLPIFIDKSTGKRLTLNLGYAEGPNQELHFDIPPQTVDKYFTKPIIVEIPDYNLVTYQPTNR
jgi:hypothetical protein